VISRLGGESASPICGPSDDDVVGVAVAVLVGDFTRNFDVVALAITFDRNVAGVVGEDSDVASEQDSMF
jgi:hypothetical protein